MYSHTCRGALIASFLLLTACRTAYSQDAAASAVTIVFQNQMQVETELFWINEQGTEESFGKIAPGGEHSQQSYPGHRWRIRSQGTLLQDVLATTSPLTAIPITGERATSSAPSRLRKWKASQSAREFNETGIGQWTGVISADDQGITATRLTASRDDQNGVVLNRQDGGFYLLSSQGLYQAPAGGTDWVFVEAGSFVSAKSEARIWESTLDPQNRWSGLIIEDTQSTDWGRMRHDGTAVDRWSFKSENKDGVVLSSTTDPSALLWISSDTLHYRDGEVWLPMANGKWKVGGNTRTLNGPVTANMSNGGRPNAPTANPAFNAPTGGTIGQQTGSQATRQDAMAALKIHNDARQRVGVQPLIWSAQVAQSAQAYADRLAATDPGEDMDHDPNLRSTPYGENITWLSGGRGSAVTGSNDWLEERIIWEENRPGEVGHYTQMVWHDTRELGIGYATGRSGSVYIVARYNRAGNVEQHRPYPGAKVFRP